MIVRKLGCPTPQQDMFADAGNARMARWWGAGGEQPDAWKMDWGREDLGILWCNPQFSDLQFVVQKAKVEGANLILICPDWRNQPWYADMWENIRAHHYFRPGFPLFELDGVAAPGIQWGAWALWYDGRMQENEKLRRKSRWGQEVQRTHAATRRYRRDQQVAVKVVPVLQK